MSKVVDAVLDDKRSLWKVVTVEDFRIKRDGCKTTRLDRRKDDQASLGRELQNIHKAIADQSEKTVDLEKAIAAMLSTIVKELRDMGVLK